MNREEVYSIIDGEREYQEYKWKGHRHEVGAYITILQNYVDKSRHAWTDNNGDEKALEEIRKIAAIAVSCMEEHGVNKRKYNGE